MRGFLKLIGVAGRSALGGGTLPVLALAALVVVSQISFMKGSRQAQAQCRTAELEVTVEAQKTALARIQSQLTKANEAQDAARGRGERDAEINIAEREGADAFKNELSVRIDRCPIGSDDAERLRRIGQ